MEEIDETIGDVPFSGLGPAPPRVQCGSAGPKEQVLAGQAMPGLLPHPKDTVVPARSQLPNVIEQYPWPPRSPQRW